MTEHTWYTDCPVRNLRGCGWDRFTETEDESKIVTVLHLLDKHPEDYRRETGKDPDEMKVKYAEYLRVWRVAL